ncbi:RNA polymerase sigma factor [Streptosporangium roseum]|uniref:RNA polymerase, sigma-24 subunit, ECF subfamily n=1 Tax=Streptosporangium roseum (strain ATCC 12428 / DSM 43021 / JCM 3005 / KCTC 9067 / NCIMB 10171 / NRRL 2505 / NI 9100) TaxID=479432 RepID=D2B9H5_STRRD|nr:RNA polymerase sigma factor [Streptosporangium roseum]ACZ83981.1 RNA polymerase, sigma-24 subunit, ECF subfamily [Streptosporangium roseum DSM 43021]
MADIPPEDLRQTMRDPEAFEVFYRRHTERVSRFVARRMTDPHTVDDLTTEVFLAAIDTADTYRPDRGSQEAWLFGIARNVVASELRRAARELHKSGRAAGRRPLDSDDIARLEERIDAERAARPLLSAIARLPKSLRAVAELVDIDGLSVTDAAAALRIRVATARVRLHRARRRLMTESGNRPETILEGSS